MLSPKFTHKHDVSNTAVETVSIRSKEKKQKNYSRFSIWTQNPAPLELPEKGKAFVGCFVVEATQ